MAEVELNVANLAREIYTLYSTQFEWIIFVIQAIGVLVILLIIFKLIGIVLEHKKRARIKRIESKVDAIDEKIDKLSKDLKKEKKPKNKKFK